MATSKIKSGEIQIFSAVTQTDMTFNIPSHYRGMMIIDDSNSNYQGVWIIAMGGSGQLFASKVYGNDSYITISNSEANKLKVTFSVARDAKVAFLSLTPWIDVSISS